MTALSMEDDSSDLDSIISYPSYSARNKARIAPMQTPNLKKQQMKKINQRSTLRNRWQDHPSPITSPVSQSSPTSSVESMITSFRASASSFSIHNSPIAKDQKVGRSKLAVSKVTSPRIDKVRPPSATRRNRPINDSDDREEFGLSPLPKLMNEPKSKPTLVTAPGKHATSSNPFKKISPFVKKEKEILKSRMPSPKKYSKMTKASLKPTSPLRSPRRPQPVSPRPPQPVLSSISNESFLEEIESPDTLDSIDTLIGKDLKKLNRLVSSSRQSLVSDEEVVASYQQKTRFRRDEAKETSPKEIKRRSSFRLYSPTHRPNPKSKEQEKDSFLDEIQSLRLSLQVKETTKIPDNEKITVSIKEISTMKEAVEVIDQNLLLAMRPFEKMRAAQDGQGAVDNDNSFVTTTQLPIATQAIVQNLEQVFGSMNRQREMELKSENESVVAAKAIGDAKRTEEAEKRKLEEQKEEQAILSLLPLQGKLLASSADVHEALRRLEYAEQSMLNNRQSEPSQAKQSGQLAQELAALHEKTIKRVAEIELKACKGEEEPAYSRLNSSRIVDDWHRPRFHVEENQSCEENREGRVNKDLADVEPPPFGEVIQREIVEKLDLTILKLKHVLNVDAKVAEETMETRKQEEIEANKKKIDLEAREKQKQQEERDAAAAQQRVMGLTSLDELTWLMEQDVRLRQSMQNAGVDPPTVRMVSVSKPSLASWHAEPASALDNFNRMQIRMDESSLNDPEKPYQRPSHEVQTSPRHVTGPQYQFLPRHTSISRPRQLSENQSEIGNDNHVKSFEAHPHYSQFPFEPSRSPRYQFRQPLHSPDDRSDNNSPYRSPRREKPAFAIEYKSSHRPITADRSTQHQAKNHHLHLPHTIEALQAHRREKASWFRTTTKSYHS